MPGEFNTNCIRTIRLNTFWPLCHNEIGARAIEEFNLPPFVDASCRREPDLEHEYPSISGLCRQDKFAPLLYPNDIIVYMSVKGKWLDPIPHYRLIAILQVIERRENHFQGAAWYSHRVLPLPSNCMVPGNEPLRFEKTAGDYGDAASVRAYLSKPPALQKTIGQKIVEKWNESYLKKSKKYPPFIITRPIFRELVNPPIISDNDIIYIFGSRINTRNPNIICKKQLSLLGALANVNFI